MSSDGDRDHDSTAAADLFRNALDRNDVALLRTALQMDSSLANQSLKDGFLNRPPLVYALRNNGSMDLIQELLRHFPNVNAKDSFGRGALHEAVQSDNVQVVKFLIELGAQVDARDRGGVTPLHLSQSGQVFRLLVTHGADMHSRDNSDKFPLMNAVERNDLKGVMTFVENGADVHMTDKLGFASIHKATTRGSLEIMQYLLQHGANVNARANDGKTPLHCCHYSLEVARLLLQHGANVHARTTNGRTALHGFREQEVARLLIQHGADVNATDQDGDTPLTSCSNVVLAQFLIDHGADPSIGGDKALERAVTYNHVEIVRLLLELGIDANGGDDALKQTPLLTAVRDGFYDKEKRKQIILLLLEYGADVNSREPDTGRTALHRAGVTGDVSWVELLIDNRADIHARDHEGWTPLLWACASGFCWDIVTTLVNHGATINDRADMKSTELEGCGCVHYSPRSPLSMACLGDRVEDEWIVHVDVVEFLLDAGACVDYRDQDGSTPLLHAAERDNVECALLLLQRGANIHARIRNEEQGSTPFLFACDKGGLDVIYTMIRFSPHHQRPQPIIQ